MPRHRPASLRRILPVLAALGLVAGALFAGAGRHSSSATSAAKPKAVVQVSLRRDAAVSGKPAATVPGRASTAPEPRKQRARVERPVAPEPKKV